MSAQGLSSAEAKKRLLRFGANEIERKSRVAWWRVLLSQLKSPLIYVLLLAGGITFVLGEWIDSGVILLTVAINTALGFFQEFKVERSLEALAGLLSLKAKVRRDGEWLRIPSREVVRGDVARLSIGRIAPADGVLLYEDGMFVNEAMITGEAEAVEKKTGDEIYMGTVVEKGIGDMEVVKTGGRTRMGGIASSVKLAGPEETPLQKKLSGLAGKLAVFVGAVALLVLIVGLAAGDEFSQIFPTAVALAVAAIPEGLAVSLTLILTVGMKRILKRKALIRRLLAAEVLGGVDVICVDKTGTLTEGKMRMVGVVTSVRRAVSEQVGSVKNQDQRKLPWLIRAMILCNDGRDPLETAMGDWGRKRVYLAGGKEYIDRLERVDELPFDQNFKYIATRHKGGVEFFSGAPEVILSKCKLAKEDRGKWLRQFENLGGLGYRLVGFGYKRVKGEGKIRRGGVGGYEWLGVTVYEDPLRKGVARALKQAKRAGIEIKVITGDYKETAWAVARGVGLVEGEVEADKLVLGRDLRNRGQCEAAERGVVFARTSPEEKLSIVACLQERGHVVAMTGDGVNDAPALKKADIGIAVGEASDVSREAADMVLLNSNFSTILAAVEEGRGMFDNLRKVLLYLLADSFSEVILVLISIVLGWPLPLLAAQILWINLVSNGFPYLALTMEPKEAGLLRRKPALGASILNRRILWFVVLISGVSGLLASGVFYWHVFVLGWEIERVRSLVFAFLAVKSLVYVFSSRSLDKPLWKSNVWANWWLILGVLGGLAMVLLVMYAPIMQTIFRTKPLDAVSWLLAVGLSVILVGVIEFAKMVSRASGG